MKTAKPKAEKRYDVVTYKIETMIIDSIVGKDMVYAKDGYGESAVKRWETVSPRLNDYYSVAIVPAGKYIVGMKLKARDKQ